MFIGHRIAIVLNFHPSGRVSSYDQRVDRRPPKRAITDGETSLSTRPNWSAHGKSPQIGVILWTFSARLRQTSRPSSDSRQRRASMGMYTKPQWGFPSLTVCQRPVEGANPMNIAVPV